MHRTPLGLLVLALGLSGCLLPPSTATRLADSAYDFNEAARFGRMDVALEHVNIAARDDFSKRHAAWGKALRIVDYEFTGLNIRPDGDADVFITVTWQRSSDTSMLVTDVAQRWKSKRGTWWFDSEAEKDGDHGLLAELVKPGDSAAPPTPSAAPPSPDPLRARYQTRVIYDQ